MPVSTHLFHSFWLSQPFSAAANCGIACSKSGPKLACQPLPGAGMNTRPREGLDDLVVGVTPRFGEATSSRTQHRKSKKSFRSQPM